MKALLITILAATLFIWIGSAIFVVAIFLRPRLRARRIGPKSGNRFSDKLMRENEASRLRLQQKGKGI